MKNLVLLIPAKKNSSRLKNKNLLKIQGKTILERKIKACKEANLGKVVVSTDSLKIKSLSLKYGADEIRLRSSKYSTKTATITAVILDYLRNEIFLGKKITRYIAVVPITNPFLKPKTIKKTYNKILRNKKINSIVSITKSITHPFLFVENNKKIKFGLFKINKKNYFSYDRSQDRPDTYIVSSAIKIIKTSYFMKNLKNRNPLFRKKPFDEHNSIGVKISYLESQDINNKLDYELCKVLFKLNKKN